MLAVSYIRTSRRPTLPLASFPKHASVVGADEETHGDCTRPGVQDSHRERDWRDSGGEDGTDTARGRRLARRRRRIACGRRIFAHLRGVRERDAVLGDMGNGLIKLRRERPTKPFHQHPSPPAWAGKGALPAAGTVQLASATPATQLDCE